MIIKDTTPEDGHLAIQAAPLWRILQSPLELKYPGKKREGGTWKYDLPDRTGQTEISPGIVTGEDTAG